MSREYWVCVGPVSFRTHLRCRKILPIHSSRTLEGSLSRNQSFSMMISAGESIGVQQGLSRFVSIRHDGDGPAPYRSTGERLKEEIACLGRSKQAQTRVLDRQDAYSCYVQGIECRARLSL